jgi:hypothetical protein
LTAASEKYGAGRCTIYDWQRQVARAAAGEGDSPTGGIAQSQVEEQRDREILAEWHRHPGLGPSQIKNPLRRRGVKVSVHTTRRVMEEAGDARIRVVRKPGSIGTYYALASRTGRETVRRPRARSRGPCLRRIGFSPGRRS